MTENVWLALIALLTLIVTNLFSIWRTIDTGNAVDRVSARVDQVHAMVSTQPDRNDLTAALAPLQPQLVEKA